MRSPKWLREAKRNKELWIPGKPIPPQVEAVNEERIKAWTKMAAFLDMDERTLRKAYKEDAVVRGYIFKDGGRYWSDEFSLATLYYHLLDRREDWPNRSQRATKQPRQRKGLFTNK